MSVKHCWKIGLAVVTASLIGVPVIAQEVTPSDISPDGQTTSSRFQRIRNAIPNQYIVVFQDGVTWEEVRQIASEHQRRNRRILHMYGKVLNGFAIRLSEQEALELSQDARVKYVQEDAIMSASQTTISTSNCGPYPASDGHLLKCVSQSKAPWHLDRTNYYYTAPDGGFWITGTGKNINAYVVDTGILTTHSEFQGRATSVYNAINDGNGSTDCNGHGTFVAALIGGNKYGTAKEANLRSVRVLDCSGNGSSSNIIAGINWITSNAIRPAVVNISFGGAGNTSVDNAVTSSINSGGLIYMIAAGNNNVDVSTVSPARVSSALTIGASDANQYRAGFSNFGTGVDYYLPGVNVYSAFKGNSSAQALASGTSFSAPIAAGIAVLDLEWNPDISVATYYFHEDMQQMYLDSVKGQNSGSSVPPEPSQTSSGNGSFKSFGTPFIY
jgi:Subtilase family/Peptidase inhibitor I9